MTLCFRLSMPGVSSWNGRWSGEGKCYAILRTFQGKKQEKKAAELLAKGSYGYSFGDGWHARVDVAAVDANESRRIRKASAGFNGYEWMVAAILEFGEILNSSQVAKRRDARQAELDEISRQRMHDEAEMECGHADLFMYG